MSDRNAMRMTRQFMSVGRITGNAPCVGLMFGPCGVSLMLWRTLVTLFPRQGATPDEVQMAEELDGLESMAFATLQERAAECHATDDSAPPRAPLEGE